MTEHKPLQALRLAKKLSQPQLARIVGTTYKRISHWENGRFKPKLEYQIKIALALSISLVKLQQKCNWPLTPHIAIVGGDNV